MKLLATFTACLFFVACGQPDQQQHADTDSTATPSVKAIPNDPNLHNMPVHPVDTSKSNMPVVNPDSGIVKPL